MAGSARAADLGHAVRPRTDDEARLKSSSPGACRLVQPATTPEGGCDVGDYWIPRLTGVLLGERLDAPPFQQTREVLPRRGHASSTFTASACPGSNDGDHGPSRGPPRNHCFAGETQQGSMIRTLWGPEWSRLLPPFQQTREVLPRRGHASS